MATNHLEQLVYIPIDSKKLEGSLVLPKQSTGIVVFAHGSGSNRFSPRNNFVARVLREAGIGTLLMDLLTEKEDAVYQTRFNIDLLTERLLLATEWLKEQPRTKDLAIGYFGASTGAAAALKGAAVTSSKISAIGSRGGRPDLAEEALSRVQSPTLLIVGGNDDIVIKLNRDAYAKLRGKKRLVIIPGATHLFEEPGKLEEVARLATDWFKQFVH